eukprot:Rhum_TRINITY_DN14723_c3_g2::Rhum_TRINITY_DN14723_c3_g2_i1::g.112514::m.112514
MLLGTRESPFHTHLIPSRTNKRRRKNRSLRLPFSLPPPAVAPHPPNTAGGHLPRPPGPCEDEGKMPEVSAECLSASRDLSNALLGIQKAQKITSPVKSVVVGQHLCMSDPSYVYRPLYLSPGRGRAPAPSAVAAAAAAATATAPTPLPAGPPPPPLHHHAAPPQALPQPVRPAAAVATPLMASRPGLESPRRQLFTASSSAAPPATSPSAARGRRQPGTPRAAQPTVSSMRKRTASAKSTAKRPGQPRGGGGGGSGGAPPQWRHPGVSPVKTAEVPRHAFTGGAAPPAAGGWDLVELPPEHLPLPPPLPLALHPQDPMLVAAAAAAATAAPPPAAALPPSQEPTVMDSMWTPWDAKRFRSSDSSSISARRAAKSRCAPPPPPLSSSASSSSTRLRSASAAAPSSSHSTASSTLSSCPDAAASASASASASAASSRRTSA